MDYTLALLFSLMHILHVTTAAPLPPEVVKMKTKVKGMSELLVRRLNEDLQIPSGPTFSPQANDMDGLSSIITVLNGYNSLISDSLTGVSQVKSDMSSLTGYLDQWRSGHCPEQQAKVLVPAPLEELQRRKHFTHTVSFEALMRTKKFLKELLKNLDHLKTC
ncbi:leptin-like [Betta splendens]|uniref:Leptin n=1 Tax=Betta splendens TaxID=158456 RepID=A0A6P7MTX3_BETSP|nr:leptin-like [Betta splendens]